MGDAIRFLLNDRPVEVAGMAPATTVLRYLRETLRRTGTKEGCAEGDCGACTVVLGTPGPAGLGYRAANACILPLAQLDGRQLLTVEDLRGPDGALHPVQQAMVAAHGTQCGFCTPGFVMSLFALFHEPAAPDEERILDTLSGNLCRCTGYAPILQAARGLPRGAADRFQAGQARILERLAALRRDRPLAWEAAGGKAFVPETLGDLLRLRADHPDAVPMAGGTDLALTVTKRHQPLPAIIHLHRVAELRRVERQPDALLIGAAVTYAEAEPWLAGEYPMLAAMLRRLGGLQVRNIGTLGGNIANASPIGDSIPPLIALGAEVVLASLGGERRLALEDFFLGYRRTALGPGEVIRAIRIPRPPDGAVGAAYKISKRFDQDISAVAAGFRLRLEGGRIAEARLAFGGMAPVPRRAAAAEGVLLGAAWTRDTAAAAAAALERDFTAIDDMRASARYRRLVAGNLLLRFQAEAAACAS